MEERGRKEGKEKQEGRMTDLKGKEGKMGGRKEGKGKKERRLILMWKERKEKEEEKEKEEGRLIGRGRKGRQADF